MDSIEELLEKIKKLKNVEDVKVLEAKSTKSSFSIIIENLVRIVAENSMLKSMDETARTLILSMVIGNGGSFVLPEFDESHNEKFEMKIEKGDNGQVILKAIEKGRTIN